MIKNFDEYVNESRVLMDSKMVKHYINRLLSIPVSSFLLDHEAREIHKQIENEFKSNNFEKVLSLIAELKVYLLDNNDEERLESNQRYRRFMKTIDRILDDVDFDEVKAVRVIDDLDDDINVNNTKLDSSAVGRSKFDFIKGIAREYFKETINKSKCFSHLSEEEEVENVYKSEIKKIRRFLGENYYLDFRHFKVLEDRLSSCCGKGYCYTFEEIKDICDVIEQQSNRKNAEYVIQTLKDLLDPNEHHKANGRDNLNNIAFSVCGKVLTGEVYYNAILNIYAKTKEEMEFLIDNFKNSSVYEVIADYFDNIPDIDKYEIVDLNKKTL